MTEALKIKMSHVTTTTPLSGKWFVIHTLA